MQHFRILTRALPPRHPLLIPLLLLPLLLLLLLLLLQGPRPPTAPSAWPTPPYWS
jgi:hypothetical protein